MKQRPILLQTADVQALLAGNKTQLRFPIKPQPDTSSGLPLTVWYGWPSLAYSGETHHNLVPPYGRPGDVLRVKETWSQLVGHHATTEKYVYKADATDSESEEIRQDYIKAGYPYQWRSATQMPVEATRLLLKVKAIRIERLNDISEESAVAEGFSVKNYLENHKAITGYTVAQWMSARESFTKEEDNTIDASPIDWYVWKWESKYGSGSWDKNPFVWVIEFERVDPATL